MKRHPLEASPVTPEFAELYALLDEIRHTPSADRILNAVGAVEMRYIAAVKAERERLAIKCAQLAFDQRRLSENRYRDGSHEAGDAAHNRAEGIDSAVAAIRSAE